jgi:hypothetical protein
VAFCCRCVAIVLSLCCRSVVIVSSPWYRNYKVGACDEVGVV